GENKQTGISLRAGKAPPARTPDTASTASPPLTLDLERRLRAVKPLKPRKADRTHTLNLTGEMAGYVWSINNVAWTKDVAPLPIAAGERVELIFVNQTPMQHPMHLHGHEFQVVEIDGKRFAGAVRDTVLVPPRRRVVVAFDANNPGLWAIHCHLLYHLDAGMFTTLRYVCRRNHCVATLSLRSCPRKRASRAASVVDPRFRGGERRMTGLKRAGARVLHVLERPRHDDAVVVATVARPDADQLVGLSVDEGVGPAETEDIVAGERPLLDEQFAHGHHLPFDLLAFGAEIVVLAGLRVRIDLGDLEHAALLPSLGQVAHVGHPIVFERRDDARGPAVEARRDVLLPVGDEIALRGLGI